MLEAGCVDSGKPCCWLRHVRNLRPALVHGIELPARVGDGMAQETLGMGYRWDGVGWGVQTGQGRARARARTHGGFGQHRHMLHRVVQDSGSIGTAQSLAQAAAR